MQDGKHEAPLTLCAELHIQRLTPNQTYALLQYEDAALVPSSGFLANRTGGVVSRVDFVAAARSHRRRVRFPSNSTTFYRVVAVPP